jgi:hypothetical protein
MITNAPWFVTNQTLHEDLNVPYITKDIQERNIKHHDKMIANKKKEEEELG